MNPRACIYTMSNCCGSWKPYNVYMHVYYAGGVALYRMPLRLVALMSTKTIVPAQELFSSYLTVVTDQ